MQNTKILNERTWQCLTSCTYFTREDSRSIRGVTLESLEGVEVVSRARGRRVPLGIKILLGSGVEKLLVVFTVFEVEGGHHASVLGRNEGRGRCQKGDGDDFGQLKSTIEIECITKEVRKICVKVSIGIGGREKIVLERELHRRVGQTNEHHIRNETGTIRPPGPKQAQYVSRGQSNSCNSE